jgi:hypothetical protein
MRYFNMNLQTRLVAGVLIVAAVVFFQVRQQNVKYSLSKDEINAIIVQADEAFDQAELSVLGVDPDPDPDAPLSPDPDPEKCICKGTGQYERPDAPGSGKMVDCPFHGSSQAQVEPNIQYSEPSAKIYVYPRRKGFLERLFFN